MVVMMTIPLLSMKASIVMNLDKVKVVVQRLVQVEMVMVVMVVTLLLLLKVLIEVMECCGAIVVT